MNEGRKHSGIYFSVCGLRFWVCMVKEVDEVFEKYSFLAVEKVEGARVCIYARGVEVGGKKGTI